VNCCSVVSIFIAFIKFRPTTYRTHPPFPAHAHPHLYEFCCVHDLNTPSLFFPFHFLLQGPLPVDSQTSLAVHIPMTLVDSAGFVTILDQIEIGLVDGTGVDVEKRSMGGRD